MAKIKSANKESTPAKRNREKLGQDQSYMEIPEMKDIPGQEHIHTAGIPGEMADTTISSDDEEGIRDGKDLMADDGEEDVDIVMGTEADVTGEDLAALGDKDQDMDLGDDELVGKAELDDRDNDGDLLNESGSGQSGKDLDIPVGDENESDEDMGEGDEENKYYSLGGDGNDDEDNGTPNEYRK